jgi:hypothetical protein
MLRQSATRAFQVTQRSPAANENSDLPAVDMAEDQEFQKTLHVAFSPPASMIGDSHPYSPVRPSVKLPFGSRILLRSRIATDSFSFPPAGGVAHVHGIALSGEKNANKGGPVCRLPPLPCSILEFAQYRNVMALEYRDVGVSRFLDIVIV